MQMICALLIHQHPDLPERLGLMSPWLDWRLLPLEQVIARLESQSHRRFIKTHTPLDGIPIDERATYIVVGRNPLDAAESHYHQGMNLDVGRARRLAGLEEPQDRPFRPLVDYLRSWMEYDGDVRADLDSLKGVLWHLAGAWSRRDEPNIHLFHYSELETDLPGQMQRMAEILDISMSEKHLELLAEAASFQSMKARAEELAPDHPHELLHSRERFFRRGGAGAWPEVLDATDLERYHVRLDEWASPELQRWLRGPIDDNGPTTRGWPS